MRPLTQCLLDLLATRFDGVTLRDVSDAFDIDAADAMNLLIDAERAGEAVHSRDPSGLNIWKAPENQ